MTKKPFDRKTEKLLQITLVPILVAALFFLLNLSFPDLYNPFLWSIYRKTAIFSMFMQYFIPAAMLSLISVRSVTMFFILQAPCILLFAKQWFSHQIDSFSPDEFLFLGVYGLLLPVVSIVLARLYLLICQKIYDKLQLRK